MTDHPTLTDDDLSLALDGEADAALLARIDADPAAQDRLEQLRRASGTLRNATVPPLSDDTVADLIATAVDTPVAPARPASGGTTRATPWLVAAAVIVLMAVGLSLVWAGRTTDQDQAGAARTSADSGLEKSSADAEPSADSSFSAGEAAPANGGAETLSGGHGAPTTAAPATGSQSSDVPVLFLGSYPSGANLREATATSFADAWKASGSPLAFDTGDPDTQDSTNARTSQEPPADAAIERCASQLQVTLDMKAPPIQTGYATVDEEPVLVYEFATTSARSNQETTLVAAVGVEACNEVVFFER